MGVESVWEVWLSVHGVGTGAGAGGGCMCNDDI